MDDNLKDFKEKISSEETKKIENFKFLEFKQVENKKNDLEQTNLEQAGNINKVTSEINFSFDKKTLSDEKEMKTALQISPVFISQNLEKFAQTEPVVASSSANLLFKMPEISAVKNKEASAKKLNIFVEKTSDNVDNELLQENVGTEKLFVEKRRKRSTRITNSDENIENVSDNSQLSVDNKDLVEVVKVKKQPRKDFKESTRKRRLVTEADFLARRESVDRKMIFRQSKDYTQIAVIENNILVEHYVSYKKQESLMGSIYVGKVQNVLPSMEAAFVDIGRGRNAVLYAGEVNWDAKNLVGVKGRKSSRKIEEMLKSGDSIMVQVSKDPVGQKGARLTSQISLPGRYVVYVPNGGMTGISRKLPDTERVRLKAILKEVVTDNAGIIVRTAAEGVQAKDLINDVNLLRAKWEEISNTARLQKNSTPKVLYGEPDLAIKVVRDIFNEDFSKIIISGDEAWDLIESYVKEVAPDLLPRLDKWSNPEDIFASYRIDEQIHKALDSKVFLPSGGSLVIDRTEAMTVVDVNTGKFTGSGGNLEHTVTKNNLEAAEEIVRQLRLRDIGGIVVIDFIDMILEDNRDLVLKRLTECLLSDRTKHQVAEVTSLGLVQMTRKRIGIGLLEAFGQGCVACNGKGFLLKDLPIEHKSPAAANGVRIDDISNGQVLKDRRKVNNFDKPRKKFTPNIGSVVPEPSVSKLEMVKPKVEDTENISGDIVLDEVSNDLGNELPFSLPLPAKVNTVNKTLQFNKEVADKLNIIEKSLDNLRVGNKAKTQVLGSKEISVQKEISVAQKIEDSKGKSGASEHFILGVGVLADDL